MASHKIKIPTIVAELLYEFVEKIAHEKIKKNITDFLKERKKKSKKISTRDFWNIFHKTPYYSQLFKSIPFKPDYFYRLLDNRGDADHLISIERDTFCDALQFLGYKIPKGKTDVTSNTTFYSYASRLRDWGTKFLEINFSGNPEYIDIVINGKIPKRKKRVVKQNEIITAKYRDLDKKVFITEIKQGHVVDKAVMTLEIKGGNKVEGILDVLYVNEDTRIYNKESYPVPLRGEFLYDKALLFIYSNPNLEIEHAGVFKLEYSSNADEFSGSYAAFFESMHPDRVSRIGHVCFIQETNRTLARKFLSESKGKPMITQSERFIPRSEKINSDKITPSISNKISSKKTRKI